MRKDSYQERIILQDPRYRSPHWRGAAEEEEEKRRERETGTEAEYTKISPSRIGLNQRIGFHASDWLQFWSLCFFSVAQVAQPHSRALPHYT